MNPRRIAEEKREEREGTQKTYCRPIAIEITVTKGNQSITLSPEEYAMMSRRMENAFINSLAVVEE